MWLKILYFSKSHQWFQDEDGSVGLTKFAAESLGDISFVDLENLNGASVSQVVFEGNDVKSSPIDCTVESSKAVADIYSPVSGTVKEINREVMDAPDKINADPMAAWLFKVDASNLAGEKGNLLDEKAYAAFCATLKK